MIEAAVKARLIASPAVCEGRVFVDFADERTPTKPYAVVFAIGGAPLLAQEGAPTLREVRIQVSVFGKSGISVRQEMDKVRAKLHYQRWSDADYRVQSCLAQEEPAVMRETDAEIYHCLQDYRVRYV